MTRFLLVSFILLSAPTPGSAAETVADCQLLLQTGKYGDCLKATTAAIANRSYGEEWPILKAQSEMALGKYPEALDSVAAGLERYSWSVRLRLLEYECVFYLQENRFKNAPFKRGSK